MAVPHPRLLQFQPVMSDARLHVVRPATDAPAASISITQAYGEHHQAVRAFARRLLGDSAAAEELVQETFLAMPAALRRFRGDGSVRSLLLGICANLARNHVRGAARRRAAMTRFGLEAEASPSGPESTAIRAQLRETLQRAMDTLSHEHRVVLVLCEVEERTSREVAEILAIPEATVRTRVFHARKKLREAFGEEER